MNQTITFTDNRNLSRDVRRPQNISLKILTEKLTDSTSFTIDITDAPKGQKYDTVSVALTQEGGKTETYIFPRENDGEYTTDWFSHIETVASDAPMEYSEEHFSVCDTLDDIIINDKAFQILINAVYSMGGIKMTKSLAAMMRDRTLLELVSTLDSAGNSDVGKKVPENALQIINAELNKISKR